MGLRGAIVGVGLCGCLAGPDEAAVRIEGSGGDAANVDAGGRTDGAAARDVAALDAEGDVGSSDGRARDAIAPETADRPSPPPDIVTGADRAAWPADAEPAPDVPCIPGEHPVIALDAIPEITWHGQVRRFAVQAVPLDLRLCPGETQRFTLALFPGERLRFWAVADQVRNGVSIDATDPTGAPCGPPGRLTPRGAAAAPTDCRSGAQAGLFTVGVTADDVGPAVRYSARLAIGLEPDCAEDVDETGPGRQRNDSVDRARGLVGAPPVNQHWVFDGVICHPAGRTDLDWYGPIAGQAASLCVTATFDQARGDLGLSLFTGSDPDNDVACAQDADCRDALVRASRRCLAADGVCGCQSDRDCDLDGDGLDLSDGRCVEARCRPPMVRDATGRGIQSIEVPRSEFERLGDVFALVEGIDGAENDYRLDVDVTAHPQGPGCLPDRHEPNEPPAPPVALGPGQTGVCDAWICPNEVAGGDWYTFEIQPDELDRSVVVVVDEPAVAGFDLLIETGGQLFQRALLPDPPPRDARGLCVNVRAGPLGGRVALNLFGEAVDYTLRILPVDLDLDPNGRCDEFVPNLANVWEAWQP